MVQEEEGFASCFGWMKVIRLRLQAEVQRLKERQGRDMEVGLEIFKGEERESDKHKVLIFCNF